MELSVNGLEKWLSNLDDQFDPDLRLKPLSFDRSSNKSLGLPGSNPDFTVFMPSVVEKLRNEEEVTPSATQQAFIDIIQEGLKRKDTNTVLIDIATLKPERQYFISGKDKSVITSLAEAVNKLDSSKEVVIRLLVGDDDLKPDKAGDDKRWDRPDNYGESLKKRYEEIFWSPLRNDNDPKTSPGYKPIFKNERATLYVGYYCPDFQPKAEDKNIKDVKIFLEKSIRKSLVTFTGWIFKPFVDQIDVGGLVDAIIVNQAPSITWNHAKILAVNGATLMTGGINYWDLYASNGSHDICDHAVKIQGDAAVSAHKWADYFWEYLETLKPKSTDNSSFWRKAVLKDAPEWKHEVDGKIPKSSEFEKIVTEKKFETLTVARIGDWSGAMRPIRYPVQVIDAVRDIILNAAWQWIQPTTDFWPLLQTQFLPYAGYPFGGNLSDDYLCKLKYFQELGINPTAWASRSARTQAIFSATHSVVICQQMLVDWLQNSNAEYSKAVAKVNQKLKLTGNSTWTGSIWPFDLLIALARVLSRICGSDSGGNVFKSDSKGIFIVLTTNNTTGNHGGWEDQTPIWEIKNRLKIILHLLPLTSGGFWNTDKIGPLVDTMVHFKRTGLSTDRHIKEGIADQGRANLYSHSKIVCVDRKLMYVGSDNAYPAYNEEHGVWIDDEKTIGDWLEKFFVPYWKACDTPDDLEPKKA